MGSRDEYVAAGSDDGRAFVWERASGSLIRVLKADEDIVNCVQVRPAPRIACLKNRFGIEKELCQR